MGKNHPVRRAVGVLRFWLVMLTVVMVINAHTATGYVLSPLTKAFPFYFLAMVAFFWFANIWIANVVIVCSTIVGGGTFLRGLEVLFYADRFSITQRLTGVTLWWFVGGTTLAFGILNLLAVSRKEAEEWVEELQS